MGNLDLAERSLARPAQRIALYWGSGTYPADLYSHLDSNGLVSLELISHLPQLPIADPPAFHRVFNFTDLQRTLESLRIGRIIFAGGFTPTELVRFSPTAVFRMLRDKATFHALRKTGFLDLWPSARQFAGFAFLSALQDILKKNAMQPLSPHELTKEYLGQQGANSKLYGALDVDSYVEKVRTQLRPRKLGVAQAHIVSANLPPLTESFGTAHLLRYFARRNTNNIYNFPVLVKLPACGFDARLDMPFIGPDTISQCRNAGVRGIVFCYEYTILYKKDEMIHRANQNPMLFLQGISKTSLETVLGGLPDQPYPA